MVAFPASTITVIVMKNMVATERMPTKINNKELATWLKKFDMLIEAIGSTKAATVL